MRTLDSGAGDSQDTQGKCQLAENLPAIRDVQEMFHDMVKKLPEPVSYTHLTLPTNREV